MFFFSECLIFIFKLILLNFLLFMHVFERTEFFLKTIYFLLSLIKFDLLQIKRLFSFFNVYMMLICKWLDLLINTVGIRSCILVHLDLHVKHFLLQFFILCFHISNIVFNCYISVFKLEHFCPSCRFNMLQLVLQIHAFSSLVVCLHRQSSHLHLLSMYLSFQLFN